MNSFTIFMIHYFLATSEKEEGISSLYDLDKRVESNVNKIVLLREFLIFLMFKGFFCLSSFFSLSRLYIFFIRCGIFL